VPARSALNREAEAAGASKTLAATVPRSLASKLIFFSDGVTTMLAPRGSRCSSFFGSTPHHWLTITSPSGGQAVLTDVPAAGTGEVAVACPFFPQLRAYERGNPYCTPSHDPLYFHHVTRLDANAAWIDGSSPDLADVFLPGHPNVISAVAAFYWGHGHDSTGHTFRVPTVGFAGCLLGQALTCTTILLDFAHRWETGNEF
jgi:hypothetical protein